MKDMPKRCNTQGKLYTDINEYLINLAKQEKETLEYMKNYQRKRGRPKKCPDQPIKRTIGEFILTFD
jgi:hypothetical protein